MIDMIILGMVITLSLMLFSNKNSENIGNLNNELDKINEQVLEEEITTENYFYRYAQINYQLDKTEVLDNILNTLYIIFLFIYIPFFLHGQTIGMKLFKIKVVKESGKQATLNDFLFRSLLIYSLGYLIITLAMIYLISSLAYLILSLILLISEFLLVIISAFMVSYRHDKKGLHDMFTKTKVIKI